MGKAHDTIGIPLKLTRYNTLTCSRWIKLHRRTDFLLCALLSKYNPMSNYVTLLSNADTLNLLTFSPISCIENKNFVEIVENYVTLIVEGNTNKVYSHMHKEKWWWHLWDGSTSQNGQLVQIYNGNIQQRLILLIGNQSRLLSVILMASGMYQKRAIFHLHVKPCIHLAGLGINEKTFANFSWHISCV